MNTRIGIIGFGVVGKAIEKTVSKYYQVTKYDKFGNYDSFGSLKQCDFVFISVPSPFDCSLNKVDDSAILESLHKLEDLDYNGIVLIKSTIPPGFSEKYSEKFNIRIVFNPEFLRESTTPYEDFRDQECIVIGTSSQSDYDSVVSMYKMFTVKEAKFYHVSLTEAEMIKSAQNTILASRVALANVIYDACFNFKIDYEKIRRIAFDNFEIIGPHMSLVPGPDGERGFGGKCLPKDSLAFSTIHDSAVIKSIIEYNMNIRNDLDKVLMNYKSKK